MNKHEKASCGDGRCCWWLNRLLLLAVCSSVVSCTGDRVVLPPPVVVPTAPIAQSLYVSDRRVLALEPQEIGADPRRAE